MSKRKSNFKKMGNLSFSVKCSFVLAVVTMYSVLFASFVSINNGNQTYALPDQDTNDFDSSFVVSYGKYKLWGFHSTPVVYNYLANNGESVFSLDYKKDIYQNYTYNKGDGVTDYGLVYLMSHAYPYVEFTVPDGRPLDSRFQTWITQMAIWIYQKEIGVDNNLTDTDLANIKLETDLISMDLIGSVQTTISPYLGKDENGVQKTLYTEYIEPLVKVALEHRNISNKNLEVSLENDKVLLDSDEKYLKSSLITVEGSSIDKFNGYSIKINNCPDGLLVIDDVGNEIKNISSNSNEFISDNISVSKFYLKVPINSLNENNKNVSVSISGSFSNYEGNIYTSGDFGRLVTTKLLDTNLNKDSYIEFNYTANVPDTHMGISKYLYVVGLLLILFGISIVYINVIKKHGN